MGTGLVVLAVGVLLCFFGIRSVNLALLASGFGLGYFVADATGASTGTALLVAAGVAVVLWLVVSLVFRFATFVVGIAAGAVIGAKLWSALGSSGTSVVLGGVLVLSVAIASATARVPAANGSSSNAPIGPFQKTVRADSIASA